MFQDNQFLECLSCLCWAVSIRSSIFLISSTLQSHIPTVGGVLCFHKAGIQDFAALSRCLTTDFLYDLIGAEVACNRKTAGSLCVMWFVNFLTIVSTATQNCCTSEQVQKMCRSVPSSEPHLQHLSEVPGKNLCNNWRCVIPSSQNFVICLLNFCTDGWFQRKLKYVLCLCCCKITL